MENSFKEAEMSEKDTKQEARISEDDFFKGFDALKKFAEAE